VRLGRFTFHAEKCDGWLYLTPSIFMATDGNPDVVTGVCIGVQWLHWSIDVGVMFTPAHNVLRALSTLCWRLAGSWPHQERADP